MMGLVLRKAAGPAALVLILGCGLFAGSPPLPDADWPLRGNDHSERHWSDLDQITSDNVESLGLAWWANVPSLDGLVATPIVVDGTAYVSGSFAKVFAFDARTGELVWRFDPKVRIDATLMNSWALRTNRGVAVHDGRVFVGTGDCRLFALDAHTGDPLWVTQACDVETHHAITGAPRVGGGRVYIGSGGSDYGARGFVAAFDVESGDEIWRFFTVPGAPASGIQSPAMELAASTWSGKDSWKSGGGTVWEGMTYDPELARLYIGVAGGIPWDPSERSPGGGDNLFLCSIVALDAKTGAYLWHYQTVPRDAWDYDAAMPIMLEELTIQGQRRKVLMQAPKNGFFYVIDRTDGTLISAEPFVDVSWAERIDLETGRPVERPEARYHENESGEATVFPSIWGGHSWQAMSYSPRSGLVYIPTNDFPTVYSTERGALMGGIFADLYGYDPHDPDRPSILGGLVAWDPRTQSQRWRVDYPYPLNGGVLSTAGDLVFQGTTTGVLNAYAATDGRALWATPLGSAVQAAPVTYASDGAQYVLVAAGWGGAPRTQIPEFGGAPDARGPARLFAFRLGRAAALPDPSPEPAPVPRPPAVETASAERIERGAKLYEAMSCTLCHGQGAIGAGGGSIPDLRYLSRAAYDDWFGIVLDGRRSATGMLSFDSYMSREDAAAIRDFVLSVAWKSHAAPRDSAEGP